MNLPCQLAVGSPDLCDRGIPVDLMQSGGVLCGVDVNQALPCGRAV